MSVILGDYMNQIWCVHCSSRNRQ